MGGNNKLTRLLRLDSEERYNNNFKGKSPFLKIKQDHVCLFDDADYNLHLSNSSYSKIFDFARFEICLKALNPIYKRHNCFLALGGTNFHFLKEIPIGNNYCLETELFCWDEKWIYLKARFVSDDKKTGDKNIHCVALARYVAKRKSRQTIKPIEAFRLCNYDFMDVEETFEKIEQENSFKLKSIQNWINSLSQT